MTYRPIDLSFPGRKVYALIGVQGTEFRWDRNDTVGKFILRENRTRMTRIERIFAGKSGGFLEPIGHFEGKGAVTSVTKGLKMTNGTRPYIMNNGNDTVGKFILRENRTRMTRIGRIFADKSGGFLEPIGHFEGKRAVTSVTKGLKMTNGTRPYINLRGKYWKYVS